MKSDHIQKTISVYDTIAQEYAKKVVNSAPVQEREKFISFLPSHGNILDAGCGSGRDSGYFSSKGFDVVGVDLSEKLLEIARKENPSVRFQKQDLRYLDFPEKSFDGIWACASLLHLQRSEVPGVLKEFYTFLKPHGILFILVKQGKGEADVAENLSSGMTRHFTYFQPDELKKMVIEAKLTVEDMYTYNEKDRDGKKRDLWWIASFSKR